MTTSFDLTLTKIFKVAQLNWQLGCLFLIFVHPFIIDMISDLTLTKIFQVAQLNWDAYIRSFIPPRYDFRSISTGMAPRHLRISRPNGPQRKKDSRNLRILVSTRLAPVFGGIQVWAAVELLRRLLRETPQLNTAFNCGTRNAVLRESDDPFDISTGGASG